MANGVCFVTVIDMVHVDLEDVAFPVAMTIIWFSIWRDTKDNYLHDWKSFCHCATPLVFQPVGLQLPTPSMATPTICMSIYTWAVAEVVEGIMTQVVESIDRRGHNSPASTTNSGLQKENAISSTPQLPAMSSWWKVWQFYSHPRIKCHNVQVLSHTITGIPIISLKWNNSWGQNYDSIWETCQ